MKIIPCIIIYSLLTVACTSSKLGSPASVNIGANKVGVPVDSAPTNGLSRIGNLPRGESPAFSIQCGIRGACWLNNRRVLWQSTDRGRNWEQVYAFSNDAEILSWTFLGDKTGWAVSSRMLHKTDDGGRTWVDQSSPVAPLDGELRSVTFVDGKMNGWLAGGVYRHQTADELRTGVPNNARDVTGKRVLEEAVFHTNDGGLSWKRQALPIDLIGRLLEVTFVNEKQGLAMGDGTLYFTETGGANWQQVVFKKDCVRKTYLSDSYEGEPDNIALFNWRLWWVSYTDGRVIKSADGGKAWCDLVQPGTISFREGDRQFLEKMHFDTPSQGWGLGSDRFLYETGDGGLTWSRFHSETRFYDMAFLGSGHALLTSDDGLYELWK